MSNLEKRIIAKIHSYNLKKNTNIVLGLSAGPDSMALVHLWKAFQREYPINLIGVHIDHRLRIGSDKEAEFVKSICEALNIKYYEKSIDIEGISKKEKIGIEEAGRIARYDFFEKIRKKHDGKFISTGHHLDDQAETILLNIVRGTGLDGLVGIKEDMILRPLINENKENLIRYLKKHNINFFIDKSNFENDYRRNEIRNELIPLLKKYNPNIVYSLNILAENARDAKIIVDDRVEELFSQFEIREDEILIDKSLYFSQKEPLQRAIIRRIVLLLNEELKDLTRAQTEEIIKLYNSSSGSSMEIHDIEFSVLQEGLLASKRKYSVFSIDIDRNNIRNPFGELIVNEEKAEKAGFFNKNKFYLPLDFKQELVLRTRKPGDFIQPFGMKGSKSCADMMKDLKIPHNIRDFYPMLCSGNEILWLPNKIKSEKSRVIEGADVIAFEFKWKDKYARL